MSLNRTRLGLESLDSRTLPSVALPVAPTIDPMVMVVNSTTHQLHGTGAGSYVGNSLVVDAGTYDKLTGTVELPKVGSFTLTGSIQGVGMIAKGRATGELVLTNSHGSITVSLQGPAQTGFSALPGEFAYTVSGATGEYARLFGRSGAMSLSLLPAPTAFGVPPQGAFTLKFM
jgi:hypothetical protein